MAKKKATKKKAGATHKLVAVHWEDIWSRDQWTSDADLKEVPGLKMEFVTIGFLVSQDKDAVVLANTRGLTTNTSERNTSGIWRIPAGVVKSVKPFGEISL